MQFAVGKQLLKYLLLLFCLFIPAITWAQDSNVLDTVVVEDYSIKSPINYPSSFSTTINTEDYEGEFETTADYINLAPGTNVRDFGGFGQLKTVRIRRSPSRLFREQGLYSQLLFQIPPRNLQYLLL